MCNWESEPYIYWYLGTRAKKIVTLLQQQDLEFTTTNVLAYKGPRTLLTTYVFSSLSIENEKCDCGNPSVKLVTKRNYKDILPVRV
jgi:hypothetical protein